jgi:hypothetical protein
VEALQKKGRSDASQFTTKIDGFLSFIPRWMRVYFFAGSLRISSHLVYDQTQGSGAVFFFTLQDNSNKWYKMLSLVSFLHSCNAASIVCFHHLLLLFHTDN